MPLVQKNGVITEVSADQFPAPIPPSVEDIRKGMVVSAMQGILTLGETNWGRVLAYRETASWVEQMIIDSAQDWRRTSQNIQFIGYLLGFSDDQMDTMFTAAALVEA
jgi:hypothetical protein